MFASCIETVENDSRLLWQACYSTINTKQEFKDPDHKVTLAVTRIFALATMATGTTFTVVQILRSQGNVLTIAASVLAHLFGQDLFIFACNISANQKTRSRETAVREIKGIKNFAEQILSNAKSQYAAKGVSGIFDAVFSRKKIQKAFEGSREAKNQKLANKLTKYTILPIWTLTSEIWLNPVRKFFIKY